MKRNNYYFQERHILTGFFDLQISNRYINVSHKAVDWLFSPAILSLLVPSKPSDSRHMEAERLNLLVASIWYQYVFFVFSNNADYFLPWNPFGLMLRSLVPLVSFRQHFFAPCTFSHLSYCFCCLSEDSLHFDFVFYSIQEPVSFNSEFNKFTFIMVIDVFTSFYQLPWVFYGIMRFSWCFLTLLFG